MNSSFYGGKSGTPFIIVRYFSSVAEMVTNFKKGAAYTEVHFDEHVLINTVDKNNPDNGKIYRRGYDSTNDLGGAIYIGTIVGPAGKAPMLELTTIEEVKKKQNQGGFSTRYQEGSYTIPSSLVPGKDGNKYNDSIEWASCCVRNENNEDSIAYIGFKTPYTVIDFTSQTVSPYYNRSDNTSNFVNQNIIDRIDDKIHPFYEKWHINVPKGIKGDAFKNFRAIPASNIVQDYAGRAEDIANNREILVYDYYHYDKNENGEPVTLYLGDYNMINSININDDGTLTIDYSHDDNLVYNKLFKWIKKITLNKDTGHFKIEYNQDVDKNGQSTIYETDLDWVKDISFDDDGSVILDYTHSVDKGYTKLLKWIKEVSLNNENGHFQIEFNHATDKNGKSTIYETDLNWVKNITFDNEGSIIISNTRDAEVEYAKLLKWIKDVSLDENGHFKIEFNYATDKDGNPTTYETDLKWISDILVSENGSITLVWANGDKKNLSSSIKWITDIQMNPNGTITINYNNGETEVFDEEIQWITGVTLLEDGTFTIKYNNGTPDYTTQLKWVNDVTIDEYGTVTIVYNYGEPTIYNKLIKYISNIEMSPNGTLTVNYNTEDNDVFDKKIKWVNEISLLEDGTFTVKYNNEVPDYTNVLKWVKDITIDNNGTISIIYNNTGESTIYSKILKYIDNIYFGEDNKIHVVYNIDNEDVAISEPIKFIENLYIDDDELKDDADYKFHVVYNTGEDISIGNSINYILETAIDKSDYHYLVYYSNKNIRNSIPTNKRRTYNGKEGWHDLGSIKDDSGILIGLNIPSSEVENPYSYLEVINYLNNLYPQGLEGDKKGKVVTIGEEDGNKRFYAFDYDNLEWYYLGTFDDGRIWNLVEKIDSPNIETEKEKLVPGGGIWFIVEGEND